MHVEQVVPALPGHHLLDHHGDGVRQLVAHPLQGGLPDQLGDQGLLRLVGQLAVRVERWALGQPGHQQVGQQVDLEAVDRRAGQHLGERHQPGQLGRAGWRSAPGAARSVLVTIPNTGVRAATDAQLAGDELVAAADRDVRRHAEADHVDLGPGLPDHVVEPAAEQRARLVQARGVDHDQLRVRAVQDAPDGVPGGLRPAGRDRDLGADQRVGERRLAGVGPPDEAREPGPEALSRPARTRSSLASPRGANGLSGHRCARSAVRAVGGGASRRAGARAGEPRQDLAADRQRRGGGRRRRVEHVQHRPRAAPLPVDRPCGTNRKSSTSPPSGRTACARTPAPAGTRCSARTSGSIRWICVAIAERDSERCTSPSPYRQCWRASRSRPG